MTVDDLHVTLEFDLGASLGADRRVVFGLAMTSDEVGYVSTWHDGDVIEVNLTSSTTRQLFAAPFSSDVVFSLAYAAHRPSTLH